jgi:penicillin-binding protein 1B
MRSLRMISARIQECFSADARRLIATWALLFIAGQTVLFGWIYVRSGDYLQANDPRRLQNRSEVSFFYAPLRLKIGAFVSASELTGYLRELGYAEVADERPGTYMVNGNTITLRPHAAISQRISFTLNRNHVQNLLVEGQPVNEIALEPLPMQEFVRYLRTDSLKEQRVRRIMIAAGSVPELLSDAVVAIEDRRFNSHHGVDVFGIAGRVSSGQGGGSSITQQLIKNTIFKGARDEFWQRYLWFLPENVQRKATDVFFALAAERLLTKYEILAAYLSVVPLGAAEGVELHGVAAASQEYFGKSIQELNMAEAATLAGMIHKPSVYVGSARSGDYTEVTARRNSVLDLMRRNLPEKYTAEEIETAKAQPVQFVFSSTRGRERPAAAYGRHFVEFAAHHLPQELVRLQAREGELRVFSTLDFRLQKQATEIAEEAAREFQRKVRDICRIRKTKADCDVLQIQIALVAIEPQSGNVLAMVGGQNSDFNHATSKRSPGSIIKPFVYVKAIEQGQHHGQAFTPATIIDPLRDQLAGYRPHENAGRRSTVRIGLAKSYNFHAVAAAESAGLYETTEFLRRVTNSSPEISGMAAIGGVAGSETSLLDLVQAYTMFPNNGQLMDANFLNSCLLDSSGVRVAAPRFTSMSDPGAAFLVTQMMRSVVGPQGTTPNFYRLAKLRSNEVVAAKSGTGMIADLWFLALMPKLIVGVWAGLPRNEFATPLSQGFSGSRVAAPVVAKFITSVKRIQPERLEGDFTMPTNVVRLRIDSGSECLTGRGDLAEYFLVGREPRPCRDQGSDGRRNYERR